MPRSYKDTEANRAEFTPLFQVEFIPLCQGGGILRLRHPCYTSQNACPKNQLWGSKGYYETPRSRPVEGENGGSSRPLTPPFRHLVHNETIEQAPQWRAEQKRPEESVQSPLAQTRPFITRRVPISGNSNLNFCKSSNLQQLLVTPVGGFAAYSSFQYPALARCQGDIT